MNKDIFKEFGDLTLDYNEEFATIEIFEDEQLLFSVFEHHPKNSNWKYVESHYIDMFHAIHRVRLGQKILDKKEELEVNL